jgi:ribosome-associated protein
LVIDVRKVTDMADYFVICSGDSDTHTRALSDYIIEELKKIKEKYLHCEGYESGHWILVDYGNVIIHLFDDETRHYYELERLWGDAEVVLGEFLAATSKT